MHRITRFFFLVCGTLSVGLAVVGMIVPILPTTPFLLLAAVCYARSSQRFLNGLLTNRWFGTYIRNYREGRGIPLREKVLILGLLWLTIGFSTAFIVSAWWLRLLLALIAGGVTIHLVRTKTRPPGPEEPLAGRVLPPREPSHGDS